MLKPTFEKIVNGLPVKFKGFEDYKSHCDDEEVIKFYKSLEGSEGIITGVSTDEDYDEELVFEANFDSAYFTCKLSKEGKTYILYGISGSALEVL